jgi:hypothetical protein
MQGTNHSPIRRLRLNTKAEYDIMLELDLKAFTSIFAREFAEALLPNIWAKELKLAASLGESQPLMNDIDRVQFLYAISCSTVF